MNILETLGLKQGRNTLKDAYEIIRDELTRKWQDMGTGDTTLPFEARTHYGYTNSQNDLNEWVQRAQNERAKELNFASKPTGNDPGNLGVGFGEPSPIESQPEVLGLADQYGSNIPSGVMDYATGYRYSPGGEYGQSRLNEDSLGILWNTINNTYPDLDQKAKETLLANLVAVAQAESGMGGAYGNPDASNYKQSNYWNWFKGGDRSYDPDFETMAQDIVKGLGGYTLGTGGKFTRDNASTYTGNDNLSFWYDQIYGPAMRAMGY